MAEATGLPSGPSFHFLLNNATFKDNRLPPRGYDSAAFEEAQSPVVAYDYPEQHHWDEATFDLPPGTATVEVRLFHQTTTREYVEFLRDTKGPGGARGRLA